MKKPNRIGLSLFDEELLALINASAKIFPITQEDIDNNINNMSYEYARVGNHIYRWSNNKWSYIIADDTDIDWSDIKNKPTTYVPKEHTHSELHSHSNKTLLDTVTESMVSLWNTVVDKATKIYVDGVLATKSDTTHIHDGVYSEANHTHPYASDTHNHDTSYYKKTEVDSKLLTKSDGTHNHDGAYYKKSEVDSQMGGKSNTGHTHNYSLDNHNHDSSYAAKATETVVTDLEGRLYNIENGYTEGHSHDNLTVLQSISQVLINRWESAYSHIADAVKHITSDERALWNTVSNKEDKFTKGTAFNKNFGTTAGTVTQGNDSRLSNARTPTAHDHDALYYKKAESDTQLSNKAEVNHTHDDRYYTESEIDSKLSAKADGTTVSGHTSNSTVHVTSEDKVTWNGKANVSQIPTKLSQLEIDIEVGGGNHSTVGAVKPTDGSMWYEVI